MYKSRKRENLLSLFRDLCQWLTIRQDFLLWGGMLHIFDNLYRKLKKFIDGLRGNIRRYVVINDPKTFIRALRTVHIAEIENDKFMSEQKSAGKRPWSAPTPH